MKSRATSTQPEVTDTRIYGSSPVLPLETPTSTSQPEVLAHTRVHGGKRNRQIRVRLKGSKNKGGFLIRQSDFDPKKHEKVGG
jgi:hypothetical protein